VPLFCLASVPDASVVVADLAASVIAEIPASIADLPAAVTLWKRALRGEILSSHPGQRYETVRQRIADDSRGRL
jgi:hypothetical protein